MIRILFFVPRLEDKDKVEKIFAENNDGTFELEIRHVTGARPVTKFAIGNDSTDVIIARGVTARAIRQSVADIPVVDLYISSYDLMDAVIECRTSFSADIIAVMGVQNMVYGAKKIEKYIGVTIVPVVIEAEDDAEIKIRDLRSQGIFAMIGGGMSVAIGARLGMKALMVHSGEQSIFNALQEAKLVAKVRRFEQERNEQLRAIMDYSTQGIIAVDKSGSINLVNKTAVDLIGLGQTVIGGSADSVVPKLDLTLPLKTQEVERGWFKTAKGQQMSISRVPIKAHNRVIGSVATFQPLDVIQELEVEIRRKIHRKGLVAKATFKDIISKSALMDAAIARAKEYSAVDSSVLIVGETGTGKELFAQSIHNASQRSNGVFVPVNCAALPENLLESELFGYVEGAFTGAIRGGKMGLFEQAHNGTIFLDEISGISPKIQGELLRVLQEKEIRKVGDDKVIPINVRIIAATNQDLKSLMKQGKFRPDLYYRLDILRLLLPPLRERTDDIVPLFMHFVAAYALRHNKTCKGTTREAEILLASYQWPGNVRELRNVAERLTVMSSFDKEKIGEQQICTVLQDVAGEGSFIENKKVQSNNRRKSGRKASFERDKIQQMLIETKYNIGESAKRLGMSRTTLWRRLKALE